VIESRRANLYAVDVVGLAAVVAALDAVIYVKFARGGDLDDQPTLRNRYGVVMAVFSGILLRAFGCPPSLNFRRSAPLDHVTFYIKCYIGCFLLAPQRFLLS
jgi:hypothetical protein